MNLLRAKDSPLRSFYRTVGNGFGPEQRGGVFAVVVGLDDVDRV
jgi:hypothetical protein